jgi:hypothetical protein
MLDKAELNDRQRILGVEPHLDRLVTYLEALSYAISDALPKQGCDENARDAAWFLLDKAREDARQIGEALGLKVPF